MDRVKNIASEADIAIVFVNADSGEEFITVEGNKGDRNDLNLWHNGDNLVSDEISEFNFYLTFLMHRHR